MLFTVTATVSRGTTLRIGELQHEISVTAAAPQVERNSIAVGDLVDLRGAQVLK